MALYGGLAENVRRNERVERGRLSVTGVGTVTVPTPMRKITGFQLTIDDNGTAFAAADPAQVSGSVSADGTTLTINVYLLVGGNLGVSIVPTFVQWQIWGTLSSGQGF